MVSSPLESFRKWLCLGSAGNGCVWAVQDMAVFGQCRKWLCLGSAGNGSVWAVQEMAVQAVQEMAVQAA